MSPAFFFRQQRDESFFQRGNAGMIEKFLRTSGR
jgi:hypothetical protein